MQKLLITGAAGMLGAALEEALAADFEVTAATRSQLDIGDFAGTRAFLKALRPDVILHAAAYTNVEEAERRPQDCYRVNYNGTLHLANAARPLGARFVYVSSTGCYGSYKQDPYCEYDPVQPTTVYHHSKIRGEEAVRALCTDFLILRTGWLFGGSTAHKKNFVWNRFKEASSKESLTSDPFQQGNPTYTGDVAAQIRLLLQEEVSGTFNLVADGHCTRYEYVKAIVKTFGLSTRVEPADKPFERLARVSPNEAALNFNLREMGLDRMPHWQESLERYIHSIRTHA